MQGKSVTRLWNYFPLGCPMWRSFQGKLGNRGVVGVWIAMVADWVVRTICFLLRVRQKLWKEHP